MVLVGTLPVPDGALAGLLGDLDEVTGRIRFYFTTNGDSYGLRGLTEALETVKRIGQKGLDIQRYKGLGEMNAEQLWETTLNPATRTILKVKLEDAVAADRMFNVLMGEKVEPRKQFIMTYALDVKNLDI